MTTTANCVGGAQAAVRRPAREAVTHSARCAQPSKPPSALALHWHLARDNVLGIYAHSVLDLTCKRCSVGQSEGLSIPRSSVRFRLKPDNSNSYGFEEHRPSNKGIKLLLKVIKAIIIIAMQLLRDYLESCASIVKSCRPPFCQLDEISRPTLFA